ncbi:hypothetical protein NPIL_126681 [Nephila pilipes]|uniref:Uncharacterized protein n=1 Tax=Nephila pilipes TaxID=299642 RepID=A0A8X6Q9G0_NEPPI|nr:hypothetical protein NPIL_81411 [Nephila pilipes]GFU13811.1 hypothetical protein NPIL_126681 [Nephila pilipes]
MDESNLNMFERWILSIKSELEIGFQIFKNHGEVFTFLVKSDETEENVLHLQHFQNLKIHTVGFETIELKCSVFWMDKLKTLLKDLENPEHYELLTISIF